MNLCLRLRLQLAEVLGPENRWYCSKFYGQEIKDPDLLLTYFVKNGGAKDFCDRFEQAMSPLNRWYCSEFYGRDVRDPETLWNYYMTFRHPASQGVISRRDEPQLCVA